MPHTRIHGHFAIDFARARGLTLHASDRVGVSPDEAHEIAREHPEQIWIDPGIDAGDTVRIRTGVPGAALDQLWRVDFLRRLPQPGKPDGWSSAGADSVTYELVAIDKPAYCPNFASVGTAEDIELVSKAVRR